MFRPENLPKKQYTCPHCRRAFRVAVLEPIKASVEVLACEQCGEPTVLELYDELFTWFLKRRAAPQAVSMEDAILACHCGGRARRAAAARCPDCKKPLWQPAEPGARPSAPKQVPLIGEPRLTPAVWDRNNSALRDELSRAALYCLDLGGSRFEEACIALPALGLFEPERAFSLLRQAIAANPEQLDEDAYYADDQRQTLFTLTVALLTAALNGGGRQVLPYVASQLAGSDRRWIGFILDAMRESDQLTRRPEVTWLEGGKARAAVEQRLRG
ncbi:MAG: hypothetical protein HY816_01135 [Candidatus Wallbacteria bacterium]|nr:hypothetical protein [Candidatus Wallbacteria bacterium]